MLTSAPPKQRFLAVTAIVTLSILGGLVAGFLTGFNPLILALPVVAISIVVAFFSNFETVVLGALILRSSLDLWSAQQIPALLAIGLDVLAILYVAAAILTRKKIHTDKFWWFFLGWVSLKAMWIVLLPLGALGMGSSLMSESIREWVRLFSMVMVYLLVMQLKDRMSPQRLVTILLLSLVGPLTAAAMQTFLPVSVLPSV
ncbi:MAG: polymerase, partial [Cyanobacteria bacterium J06648_10]